MSEVFVWVIVVTLAVVLAAVPMVAFHVQRESRRAFEATVRNAMAHLQPHFHSEPAHTFEAGFMQGNKTRRNRLRAGAHERRAIARRRLEDIFPSLKTRRLGA
jgi:hypothetical protein